METAREYKLNYPIYPNSRTAVLRHEEGFLNIKAEALVRIQRAGKWYFVLCKSEYRITDKEHEIEGVLQALHIFHEQVYKIIHLYKMDTRLIEDDDQSDEQDRLIEVDPILKSMHRKHGK